MNATISLVLAVVGLLASRLVRRRFRHVMDPHVEWALGVGAIAPAWLVAIVGLLGSTPRPQVTLLTAIALLGTIAAALGGAITTEARVRAGFADHARAWRLGVVALLPAWAVAVVGDLLSR
jgi:hypothetical protein